MEIFCWNFRRWLLVILAPLHLAHLGCVHMKTLACSSVLWPGIDSDIEKIVKDIPCQVAYPNKDTFRGRPTQACILDLKNWFRSRISELSWNLFRITLCAFNTLPSFCHGNYRSETIIYNSGTRISDKGSTVTLFEFK